MGNILSSERREAMNKVNISDHHVAIPPHSKNG